MIAHFASAEALDAAVSGGKGVNLARLTQAGLRVPDGFVVTTAAYAAFLAIDGVGDRLSASLGALDASEGDLEERCAAIRQAIEAAPLPAGLHGSIAAAYSGLGDDAFVAVRSSGTAEDLADASFAGQHDTYLDVRGGAAVAAAVRRCWASLWTARAVAYRQRKGIAHDGVSIAVVVQTMVRADISGVLFTANPITTATDEFVINATWGLGEALVQGIVTPDQVVVQSGTGAIVEQSIGAKEVRIVRADAAVGGIREEEVPAPDRARLCLDMPMIAQLTKLGARVQAYYGDLPQDIEWAIEGDALYLLQARPITGVAFSWDTDVDAAHDQDVGAHTVWTRTFGDALASGVVTPLTYSTRFPIFSGRNMRRMWAVLGLDDLTGVRAFKYWKGELYYNSDLERQFVERVVPPQLRPMLLDFVPPVHHDAVIASPADPAAFLRSLLRWQTGDHPDSPTNVPRSFEAWRARTDYEGLSYAQLESLGDEELVSYCARLSEIFGEWNDLMWAPFLVTLRIAMSGLRWMIAEWDGAGDTQATFAKLIAGATRRTDTQLENHDLQALAGRIRRSAALREALETGDDASFFDRLGGSEDGRAFTTAYAAWIGKWGHRGHADRDYLYPRRAEDPTIDVRAFRLLVGAGEPADPAVAEKAISALRDATLSQVCARVAAKPGGAARAEILKALHGLIHQYLVIRDNERARPTDVLTFARKRGYVEMGRRLHDRGSLDAVRDVHFLAERELFDLFRGRIANTALLQRKVRARERDCERMLARQANMPMHLQRNRAVDLEHPPQDASDGVFRATATSPGKIRGVARVVMDHGQMGRVRPGEILVTHSTDPGWNPVFGIVGGVIVETGGMLSHASCLAREYGLPAVHLPHAAGLIPDGAAIELDGDLGAVTLLAGAESAA